MVHVNMMLSCQHEPESLRNVSSTLSNRCHEEFSTVLGVKGGLTKLATECMQ